MYCTLTATGCPAFNFALYTVAMLAAAMGSLPNSEKIQLREVPRSSSMISLTSSELDVSAISFSLDNVSMYAGCNKWLRTAKPCPNLIYNPPFRIATTFSGVRTLLGDHSE